MRDLDDALRPCFRRGAAPVIPERRQRGVAVNDDLHRRALTFQMLQRQDHEQHRVRHGQQHHARDPGRQHRLLRGGDTGRQRICQARALHGAKDGGFQTG